MTSASTPPPDAFVLRDGRVLLTLDLRVYRLAAVQKTAYRLAASCTAILGQLGEHTLDVALTFAPATTAQEAAKITRLFYQELLDQELREKVGEETAPLRALLLAHAFSRTSLPPGG